MAPHESNARSTRRRRLAAAALVAAALAVLVTLASTCSLSVFPPGATLNGGQGAATARAFLRTNPAAPLIGPNEFEAGAKRTILVGNLIASSPVLERIGGRLGVDPESIAATAEANESVPVAFNEPDAERRAHEILVARDPLRIDVQAQRGIPVLSVYAQAPTVGGAEELAEAAIVAANGYLRSVAAAHGVRGSAPLSLEPLGPARGGPLDPTAPYEIAMLTFLTTFGIAFGALFLLGEVRRGWLRGAREAVGRQSRRGLAAVRHGSDDWPHTTRVLPWMIAGFIVMLWLMPINAITVQASLPVDLKLDRLVLPVIVLTWLLSLASGGPAAPRWRFTTIHAAIAIFVAAAFLSVVVNAAALNQALELELAIKKLTLLAAYASLFLVVASAVRPGEVRPFLTLTLVLAVICGLGILWEYRLGTNLFYTWSAKLLPSFFEVAEVNTMAVDEVGRRSVIGSADLSLEAVAMLSLALPIALVRLMQLRRLGARLLYGLAVCILLGAMVATYRKSALLAPLTVCLVLAYFRRRELLRLAPLGLVILLAIPALAPNALGSVIDQFEPNRLGVATVSDRVSDYDAIRPDLLTHFLFGRGFGSYEHTIYRVLDNDLLMRIVETGVVGLIAYLLMLGMMIGVAVPLIRARDPDRSAPALMVAAAAAAFLVLSVLFDVMSFPHSPYILMILAGLLAVISGAGRRESSPAAVTRSRDPALPPAPPPRAVEKAPDSVPVSV
jgi:hypothetical protein